MEFGKQIKKLRQEAQLSQEELAERIYVSRQTISNWENDKSYPDVNSLVLLSETFQISLDKLIKGDIEIMKDVIQKEEIEKMNRYGGIYTMMLIASAVSAVPLFMLLGVWALIPWGIIWGIAMYFAFMLEKIKKDNDVQTYKEIVAFSEGQLLDDIQKQREIGKRQFRLMNVLKDTAYPVGRQDRHFYFRLFLLLRKASNAITRLPKAHNNVNMPMKIERISKAVICATSLPMYSGKPVIRCWEATTLSWVLSYGLRHATNISFFPP